MTQTSYPLAQSLIQTPQQWSNMAQNWLSTGVIKTKLNELSVYADSTGMQCKVKSGQAFMKGHFFQSDPETVLAIATANATNPRIDRVVVRLDYTLDSIQLAILQGVPAASPSAPALTQNSTRWEISLAQVYVGANVSTIAAGNITDERNFVKNANAIQANYQNLVLQNSWVSISGFATPGYLLDEMGFVHLRGSIANGATTSGTIITTLPAGYRPLKTIFVPVTTYYSPNGINSTFQINPDGTITCYGNVGSSNLSLDVFPIFKAEQ